MNCRKSHQRRQVLSSRGVVESNPPPTAEQIKLRKIEQERRRLEVLTNQLDLNMQSDVMTEFEESLKGRDRGDDNKTLSLKKVFSVATPEHSPTTSSKLLKEEGQADSNESRCS